MLQEHSAGAAMTELIAAWDWLTVCQLPPCAHELNPVEPAPDIGGGGRRWGG